MQLIHDTALVPLAFSVCVSCSSVWLVFVYCCINHGASIESGVSTQPNSQPQRPKHKMRWVVRCVSRTFTLLRTNKLRKTIYTAKLQTNRWPIHHIDKLFTSDKYSSRVGPMNACLDENRCFFQLLFVEFRCCRCRCRRLCFGSSTFFFTLK